MRGLPDVGNIKLVADHPRTHLLAEQPLEQILIKRQRALRDDGVAELLELLGDAVVDSGIVMVGSAEDDDSDAVLALELIKNFTRPLAHAGLVLLQRLEARRSRAFVFLREKAQNRIPCFQHLPGKKLPVGEIDERIEVMDAALAEEVVFVGKSSLDRFGGDRDGRAGIQGAKVHEWRAQNVEHRKEDAMEWPPQVLDEEEVVHVGHGDLRWKTRVD
jgi:hypothetical protein